MSRHGEAGTERLQALRAELFAAADPVIECHDGYVLRLPSDAAMDHRARDFVLEARSRQPSLAFDLAFDTEQPATWLLVRGGPEIAALLGGRMSSAPQAAACGCGCGSNGDACNVGRDASPGGRP